MKLKIFPSTTLFLLFAVHGLSAEDVSFSHDVRPILSRACFQCHGPDEAARKAGLRLDLRESAIAETDAGSRPIVPENTEESELVFRINSDVSSEQMPPPGSKLSLSDDEKKILKKWIDEGAVYEEHWAFVPPIQSPLPSVKQPDWPRNAIDQFILARLEHEGLNPNPRADRHTLARRLHLDLIGLPPSAEELANFINDTSPDAYERLVDRLLASPHYGERWARRWLDLARYADTNGYEKDRPRSMWPYRDWVIDALNSDMPFDQFTIKQIAGDMLPNPSLQDHIATGFHRNTMINEEGGNDPLEFRFHAMTDRVATTGTVWLGLTVGCAQCHTHKYDPITHREYYEMMAFLNNIDELPMPVPQPDIAEKREKIESQIAKMTAELPTSFPPEEYFDWTRPRIESVATTSGAATLIQNDGSIRVAFHNPDKDTYTINLQSDVSEIAAIQIEALTDPSSPQNGPGRSANGNVVLTEVEVRAAPADAPDKSKKVRFKRAEADFAQVKHSAGQAIDGNAETGWGIWRPENHNVNRALTLVLRRPTGFENGTRWTVTIHQNLGYQHTLGRFRITLGTLKADPRPIAERRELFLQKKFDEWLSKEEKRAVKWQLLQPIEATSNTPLLSILNDGSVLSSGDQSKKDIYKVKLKSDLKKITAIRLECLPDERLPNNGPGRVYYEGPFGDFFLADFTMTASGQKIKLTHATHTYSNGGNNAAAAIDDSPLTGWSIADEQGKRHSAVFLLANPLINVDDLDLSMLFEKYYAAGMGRFQIWATADARPAVATGLPVELELALLLPRDQRTAAQTDGFMNHFLSVAPELSTEHARIERLRKRMPEHPTTLVLRERPQEYPRPTHIHKRGEFMQPTVEVQPDPLDVLHPIPSEARQNRLTFARWLIDEKNPLVGRVVMNRQWAAFFGQGIVRTTEDFGFQGESPTHPQLLDWLAVEFMNQGWSLKAMHKLIVMSATYQQSSKVRPELLERDPENKLLSRAPRNRLDAELVRDAVLRVSGLLSSKIGGPSVFPPQPPGVTTEGAYGPLQWKVSKGEDRFRRGLYTFMKRTAPYAMFNTFDAPSGEACVARREQSNTPLQALTLLNDKVFVEAAQALGREYAESVADSSIEDELARMFLRILSRPIQSEELTLLVEFYKSQEKALADDKEQAEAIAGKDQGDVVKTAAWALTARALLNLDEFITRE